MAGKGGVGKTTVCAAVARTASDLGLSALVLAIDRAGHPKPLPDGPVDPRSEVFADLAADASLVEYLETHGFGRLSRRLLRRGFVEVAATAAPGIKDILLLGKVAQLERNGAADLIVVDAPASGHALRFLASARGLSEMVASGPLRAQADQVSAMLSDGRRARVLLVTLAEETPVNEVADTAYALEDRAGVALAAVVVNGLYPPLEGLEDDPVAVAAEAGVVLPHEELERLSAAARFRLGRRSLQQEQVARLGSKLPLPQIHLPFLFDTDVAGAGIDRLADALRDELTPVPSA